MTIMQKQAKAFRTGVAIWVTLFLAIGPQVLFQYQLLNGWYYIYKNAFEGGYYGQVQTMALVFVIGGFFFTLAYCVATSLIRAIREDITA